MSLVFLKKFHDETEWKEVTHDEALRTLLTKFRDCDFTRDMLTLVNRIPCRFSTIEVHNRTEHGDKVLMAGYQYATPAGIEYDEDGNRIQ